MMISGPRKLHSCPMSIVEASWIVLHRILAFVFPYRLGRVTVTVAFIELLGNVRADGGAAESLSLSLSLSVG